MVDLKARPYYLDEEDIAWVNQTIENMTPEEKVGQLFFQLTSSQDEEYLKELCNTYHLGGARYNNMPASKVAAQNRILQTNAKVPMFIATNTEAGGNGASADGTYIGSGIKIGATRNQDYAYDLGRLSNMQAAAMGCNMAFAPVCDIAYNWQNTEIISRAFGSDPELVAEMSVGYLKGAHKNKGFACAAKHFPGNGLDFRDAHLSNNVNDFDLKKWDETYGKVYRDLIENDLDAIMGGHIMMPAISRELVPGIEDKDILPATLAPEIMTSLLRDHLGFNGMVVTDASHMVGMTDRMPRKDMLPATINAGCDMFLFFNDPKEDFETMLNAYTSGIISEERMTEALSRILGLKAHMGLNKKSPDQLVPDQQTLEAAIANPEPKTIQDFISDDSVTLVKYLDKDVLPITPERYKRIMIVHIKGEPGPMGFFAEMLGGKKQSPAEMLRDRLIEQGFDAFIYESPLDKMKKQIAAGEKPSLNLYFAGKNAIEDFVSGQDLILSVCDVRSGRPSFGLSKGGGEIPWYVHELPVVVVGVEAPTMLADIPQARTYINTYDKEASTMDALVNKLIAGEEAFKGKDPIDSYCGLFDARF